MEKEDKSMRREQWLSAKQHTVKSCFNSHSPPFPSLFSSSFSSFSSLFPFFFSYNYLLFCVHPCTDYFSQTVCILSHLSDLIEFDPSFAFSLYSIYHSCSTSAKSLITTNPFYHLIHWFRLDIDWIRWWTV